MLIRSFRVQSGPAGQSPPVHLASSSGRGHRPHSSVSGGHPCWMRPVTVSLMRALRLACFPLARLHADVVTGTCCMRLPVPEQRLFLDAEHFTGIHDLRVVHPPALQVVMHAIHGRSFATEWTGWARPPVHLAFVDRGHTPNFHASGNARFLLHRCMGPVPDDLEASKPAATMATGQNAVTTWLGTAAPRVLFVTPQLVRRAVIATAFARAMSTRENRPSGAVATTSMPQLLWANPQAVGQWIRLVVNKVHDLQHVGTSHDSLLKGKSGPARRLPPVHSSKKWTGT